MTNLLHTTKKTKEWTTFGATFSPSHFRPASCEHAPRGFVLPPAPLPSGSPSIPASLPFHPRPAPLPFLRPARQVARARTPDRSQDTRINARSRGFVLPPAPCAPLARSPVLAPPIEARTRGSTPGRADSATSPEPHPLPPAGAPAALYVRRCSHPRPRPGRADPRQVARARTPDHPAPLPSPPSYRSLLPLHQRRVTQRGSPPPIVVVEAGQAAARSSRALGPPRSERPHGKPSPPPSWSSRSCSPSPGQDMIAQASRQAV